MTTDTSTALENWIARIHALMNTTAETAVAVEDVIDIFHWLGVQMDPAWHKRRCYRCNPRGHPARLGINGHEYARRRRHRTRAR